MLTAGVTHAFKFLLLTVADTSIVASGSTAADYRSLSLHFAWPRYHPEGLPPPPVTWSTGRLPSYIH